MVYKQLYWHFYILTLMRFLIISINEYGRMNGLVTLTLYWAQVNYSAPHQIIWSWYTGCCWVGCYIWYREEETGRSLSPPRSLLAVPNLTVYPSTASVPITVLLYGGPLLCGFTAPIKGLNSNKPSSALCSRVFDWPTKSQIVTVMPRTANLARTPLQGAAT